MGTSQDKLKKTPVLKERGQTENINTKIDT